MVRSALERGALPSATLVATTFATATELKTLAKAHGLEKAKLACVLMFDDAPGELDMRWVQVQRKGQGPELKKYPVLALGDTLPDFPACQVSKTTLPAESLVASTFRVTIPSCFCTQSWRHCQSKPANVVTGLLKANNLDQNFIATYGWRTLESQQWKGFSEAVTGFLKVEQTSANSILQLSGRDGVFIEPLAKDRSPTPIEWILQERDEDDHMYFQRIFDQTHSDGMTYRRQGRSLLGIRMPAGATSNREARMWETRGISSQWSTGRLTRWLEAQQFTEVALMSQPTKQRGWLFRAIHANPALCFAYEHADGEHISVSQFFHKAKSPTKTPIKAAGKSLGVTNLWNAANGSHGVRAPLPPPVAPAKTEPAAPAPEGQDDEMLDAADGAKRSHPCGASPEKKRLKENVSKDDSDTHYQGFEFLDPGGSGDCGYRSLAVAYALQDKRDPADVIQIAKNLGATLRAQVTCHLSKYNHFQKFWAPDPRWTEATEGGSIPQTYCEWVEATARPARWIDGPCLSTAATKLRRSIAVWRWEGDEGQKSWVKQTVITPIPSHEQIFDDASKHPPLPLFLKDGHYTTLKLGNKPIPMSWHHSPANSHWDAGNARGGVKSHSSWLPQSESASACDAKSYRSWLPASSSNGSANAKAVPIVGATVANSRKKSFRSWLPSSTASFSACAKGSAASSTKNIVVKRPKPAKKVRNTLTKKERLIRREAIKKDFAMKPHSWRCPQCQVLLSGTYGSVNSSRLYHWKTKHPELPVTTIQRSAPTVFSVSLDLPADQRMWSCPLCDAGLPFLSRHDRYKAVQHHIKECHEGETMTSLYNKQRSSIKKPAVALKQTQKFAAKRASSLRGHAPVRVEPTECMKKTKKRNFYYYCTKCLSRIQTGDPNAWDLTCKQHLAKQAKKDTRYCGIKTYWWVHEDLNDL